MPGTGYNFSVARTKTLAGLQNIQYNSTFLESQSNKGKMAKSQLIFRKLLVSLSPKVLIIYVCVCVCNTTKLLKWSC